MAKRKVITDFNIELEMPFGPYKGKKIVDCYKGKSSYFNGLLGPALAAGFPEVDRLISLIKKRVRRHKEMNPPQQFRSIDEADELLRVELERLDKARLENRRDDVLNISYQLKDLGYDLKFSWQPDHVTQWKPRTTPDIRKLFQ